MYFCVVDTNQEKAVLKGAGANHPSFHWRSGVTREVTTVPQAPFWS